MNGFFEYHRAWPQEFTIDLTKNGALRDTIGLQPMEVQFQPNYEMPSYRIHSSSQLVFGVFLPFLLGRT